MMKGIAYFGLLPMAVTAMQQFCPPIVPKILKMINIAADYGTDVGVVISTGINAADLRSIITDIKSSIKTPTGNTLYNCVGGNSSAVIPLESNLRGCSCAEEIIACTNGTSGIPNFDKKVSAFCVNNVVKMSCQTCHCPMSVFDASSPQMTALNKSYIALSEEAQKWKCDIDHFATLSSDEMSHVEKANTGCFNAGIVFAVIGGIPVLVYMIYLGTTTCEDPDEIDEEDDQKWWMIVACHVFQDLPQSTILTFLLLLTVESRGRTCTDQLYDMLAKSTVYDEGYTNLALINTPVTANFGIVDLLGSNALYSWSFITLLFNVMSSGVIMIGSIAKSMPNKFIIIVGLSPVLMFLWICFALMPFFGAMYWGFLPYIPAESSIMETAMAFWITGIIEWIVCLLFLFCIFYKWCILGESPFDKI